MYVYIVFRFLRLSVYYVTLSYKTQKKIRRTQSEYADKRNHDMQNTSCKSTCASHHSAVPLWCFLWWCGGVFVLLFFVVVFLWWCVCGGVLVLIFFCWCSRAGLFVVVFLWWCGRVCVMVFLCRCFCGGVVMFLCWCGGVFVVVFLWWCSCGGVCVVVLVWQTTRRIRRASNNFHRKSFQNGRFMRCFRQFSEKKVPEWSFRARLPPHFKEKASKMIVSCDASDNFHRPNFQNERFAWCFRQFSQKKLPKWSFRARLLSNFTEPCFQNERFARCFRQFSQKKLPKWSFRARLPPNFTEQCSQNERFARCFRQFSPKICVSLQFRAIETPIPARGFIRQKQNVPRTTAPCIPKFQNVRFATAACAKMYESIDREPTRFAHTKM